MHVQAKKENIYILIPAYNEEGKIESVILELRRAGYKNILIIDDCSRDNTKLIADKNQVEVIALQINRGQGAALRAGIKYLREKIDPDIIVTFDADGQHQSTDIESLIDPILNDGYDVTLGSRFLKNDSKIPFFRKYMLKAGVLFTNITSGVKLTDTHNGFRALGKKAINSINITHRGMEHATEIIDQIKKKRLKYTEVPVKILYSEYSLGKGQRTSNFIKIGTKIITQKLIK